MKTINKTIILAFIGASSCMFTSCVVEPGANGNLTYDPAAYAPANNYAADQQAAYRMGYGHGRSDGQTNKSQNFRRYSYEYNPSTQYKFSAGYRAGYTNYTRNNVHGNHPQGYGRMTATVGQRQVQIMQNGRVVSTLRTASPNIESHHFTSGQSQMVVKSRGNHGPATVELFDTRTGVLRDKVLAYAIKNGQPSWARGMQD
ncbi:hypothetical protein HW115_09855 [Verrucomicrobiaceae bacterium N1E253]|uniref:Lipoprotein n=1 Tax=Oceaniferula marina TaxID=2748318 RepID=A0A851GES1_9BACT|nr:hypothetical protein [Oceaniferula marina]NWK55916.1 hypothetical protein [Oceaniferula marina]